MHQAGGNAPRGQATRWDSGYEGEGATSGAGGSRRLTEKPRQGDQVRPDVGEEEKGLAARLPIDGEALEAPALKGGVAALGGIAGAGVEAFPGWQADGDVADEAGGAVVFESERHVDDPTVVRAGVQIGALRRKIR